MLNLEYSSSGTEKEEENLDPLCITGHGPKRGAAIRLLILAPMAIPTRLSPQYNS